MYDRLDLALVLWGLAVGLATAAIASTVGIRILAVGQSACLPRNGMGNEDEVEDRENLREHQHRRDSSSDGALRGGQRPRVARTLLAGGRRYVTRGTSSVRPAHDLHLPVMVNSCCSARNPAGRSRSKPPTQPSMSNVFVHALQKKW